jgi:hypothetical protein
MMADCDERFPTWWGSWGHSKKKKKKKKNHNNKKNIIILSKSILYQSVQKRNIAFSHNNHMRKRSILLGRSNKNKKQ